KGKVSEKITGKPGQRAQAGPQQRAGGTVDIPNRQNPQRACADQKEELGDNGIRKGADKH
ncbi:MAG: hypothetical protein QGF00_20150, partial [Planctomycetota bacterium]|nr:hypothetical protein [Planctomycetota bacterium]